jgi:hypothetical protein
MGLRRMEWLFLTCHNYWIAYRLVRDAERPFLVYSPMIRIQDSSVPFRALLGAILSAVKDISVDPSEFSHDIRLDIDAKDKGPSPEDHIDGTVHDRETGHKSLSPLYLWTQITYS